MVERITFHTERKGSFEENEDWWRLVIEDDGSSHVEHEWSYVNAYGRNRHDSSGTQSISVADFLSGDHDATARKCLQELLESRSSEPTTR